MMSELNCVNINETDDAELVEVFKVFSTLLPDPARWVINLNDQAKPRQPH